MPCTAPVRGKTDLINPWEPLTDNDPCGQPIITGVGGVDVSGQNLCGPHYAMKYGLSAIPQPAAADPATVLLMHADGPDASILFSDASGYGHPLTKQGTGRVSTAQSKFGGSAAIFDNGGFVTSPDSPEWALPGDFTLEAWVNWIDPLTPSIQCFMTYRLLSGGQNMWMWRWQSPGVAFYYTVDGTTAVSAGGVSLPGVAAGTWCHLACVRSGNNLMMFKDGVLLITASLTARFFVGPGTVAVGANVGGGFPMNAYMDEVRITRAARWTSNFSVPTAPYT